MKSKKSFKGIVLDRRIICIKCDKNTKKEEMDLGECIECGCFIYGKTMIPISKCPLEMWEF